MATDGRMTGAEADARFGYRAKVEGTLKFNDDDANALLNVLAPGGKFPSMLDGVPKVDIILHGVRLAPPTMRQDYGRWTLEIEIVGVDSQEVKPTEP